MTMSNVWPPPPERSEPPTLTDLRPFYKEIVELSRVVSVMLGATVVTDCADTIATSIVPSAGERVMGAISFALSLVTAILFLIWTYRAYANLRVLTNGGVKFKTAWAVASFLVPIISL